MDAQLEPFFALQREINYISGSLIWFHYKVYKRVKARKKEEARKKKAKAAAAKKKKGRGSTFRSGASFASNKATPTPTPAKPTVSTPAKAPAAGKDERSKTIVQKSGDGSVKSGDTPVLKMEKADSQMSATMAPGTTVNLGDSTPGISQAEPGFERADSEVDDLARSNSIIDGE